MLQSKPTLPLTHEVVFGMTQHGKTYYAVQKARKFDGAVLFINPKMSNNPFTTATGADDAKMLFKMLQDGRKIDFQITRKRKQAIPVIEYLIDGIFERVLSKRMGKIMVIVDEAHMYARNNGFNPVEDIATQGLGVGIYGIFVTQRPANLSNTLISQSDVKTFFWNDAWEDKYFKEYHIDSLEMKNRILSVGALPNYSYCHIYQGEMLGPFKEG